MGKTKVLAITPLLFAMYGCSSDSDSDSPAVTPAPGATSGIFLDAEVEGLSFTTDSGITGTTDENGTYEYIPGENVSFSVGGVNIGSVAGAPKCTPYDFATASSNIARFLQSLDADGDPSNGIDIVAANTALAGTTISSDVFLDAAVGFESNTAITDAVATGKSGAVLIDEATAISNLVAGTDDTFDALEFFDKEGNVFVVIDPVNNGIGLMAFSTSTVFTIFSDETTGAVPPGDGLGFDENWAVDGSGVLTFTDPVGGSTTTINRVGGSSRSISVTYSEDGATPLPATLLIPQTITDLGGETSGGAITSKVYDIVDLSGGPAFEAVFSADNTFAINDGSGDTGFFAVGDIAPNVITITDVASPTIGDTLTFLIVLGNPTTGTADMLIVDATITGGTPSDPQLEYNAMGIGSVVLTGTNTPPV